MGLGTLGNGRWLFGFALLGACAGKAETGPSLANGDASALFGSGTRLRAHYLDAGHGARRLLAFHDSELDIECTFQLTSPGEYACLPDRLTVQFADPACQSPRMWASATCGQPAPVAGLLVTAPSPSCDALNAPYSIDQPTLGLGYTLRPSGECEASRESTESIASWTLKPEPLGRFVRGRPSTLESATKVSAVRVTGDDGAFVNVSLTSSDEPCAGVADGASFRCIPGPSLDGAGAFLDASCRQPGALRTSTELLDHCLGRGPRYEVVRAGPACQPDLTFHSLEPVAPPVYTSVVRSGEQTCSAVEDITPGQTGLPYFRRAALVPNDSFERVQARRLGRGEVATSCFTDASGTPLLQRAEDLEVAAWTVGDGSPCTLGRDSSGRLRCFHHALPDLLPHLYRDPACTEPVYVSGRSTCSPETARYLLGGTLGAGLGGLCQPAPVQVHELEPYSGATYNLGGAGCMLSNREAFAGATFWIRGTAVDVALFPELTEVTE